MDGWNGQSGGLAGMGFTQNLNAVDDLRLTYTSATEITILAGSCNDSTNGISLNSPVPLLVDITAAGAGGLDTGAVAANTMCYVWLIYNPTTNTYAGMFSLSDSAPTMPAGYTYMRRLGAGTVNNSTELYNFIMHGTGRERTVFYRADVDVNSAVVNSTAAWVAGVGLVVFIHTAAGDIAFGGVNSVINCSHLIPSFSRVGIFHTHCKGTYFHFAENGIAVRMVYIQTGASTGYSTVDFELQTDTTQNIWHARVSTGGGTGCRMGIRGYRFTL